MKKNLVYLVLIVCAVLAQTSVITVWGGARAVPDLMLMLVLAWTIRDGFAEFIGWAVFMGVLYDLLTFMPVGTHVIIFTVSAYLVSFFSRRFSVHIRGAGAGLIFFFVLAAMVFSHLVVALAEVGSVAGIDVVVGSLFAGLKFTLGEFFVNAMFVFAGLWLIKSVKKYFFI